jgi:hypothetical protein
MKIPRLIQSKNESVRTPPSPEEMIEERLEKVRVRANVLKVERGVFDSTAFSLAAFFIWYIFGRNTSAASLIGYLLAGTAVVFAVCRLVRVRRGWTGKDGAAALIDGEMRLKQRLVTFREYEGQRVKPRLYTRLASDIVAELSDGNVRKLLPHRTPASAYVALAIIMAFLLDFSLKTVARREAERAPRVKQEEKIAREEEREEKESPPAEEKEEDRHIEEPTYSGKQAVKQQMAQMKQEMLRTIQELSQQLEQMEQGSQKKGEEGAQRQVEESAAAAQEGAPARSEDTGGGGKKEAGEAQKMQMASGQENGGAEEQDRQERVAGGRNEEAEPGEQQQKGLQAGSRAPAGPGGMAGFPSGAGGEEGEGKDGGGKPGSGQQEETAGAERQAEPGGRAAGEGREVSGKPETGSGQQEKVGGAERQAEPGGRAAGEGREVSGKPETGSGQQEETAGIGKSGVKADRGGKAREASGEILEERKMETGERAAAGEKVGEQVQEGAASQKRDNRGEGEEAAGGREGSPAQGEAAEKTLSAQRKAAAQGKEPGEGLAPGAVKGGKKAEKREGDMAKGSAAEQNAATVSKPESSKGTGGRMAKEAAARAESEGGESALQSGPPPEEISGEAERLEVESERSRRSLPEGAVPGGRASGTPEPPTTEVKEKVYIRLEGEKDESGRATRRLTLSPAESGETSEERAPKVGADAAAQLSEDQAEEDAVEAAPIPPEYREIIKRIHSD